MISYFSRRPAVWLSMNLKKNRIKKLIRARVRAKVRVRVELEKLIAHHHYDSTNLITPSQANLSPVPHWSKATAQSQKSNQR